MVARQRLERQFLESKSSVLPLDERALIAVRSCERALQSLSVAGRVGHAVGYGERKRRKKGGRFFLRMNAGELVVIAAGGKIALRHFG